MHIEAHDRIKQVLKYRISNTEVTHIHYSPIGNLKPMPYNYQPIRTLFHSDVRYTLKEAMDKINRFAAARGLSPDPKSVLNDLLNLSRIEIEITSSSNEHEKHIIFHWNSLDTYDNLRDT